MQHQVLLKMQGSKIIVDLSSLDAQVGDSIDFISADGNEYDIVIPNKDNFLVNTNSGAAIENSATSIQSVTTNVINNVAVGTVKYYSVTTPGGGVAYAPPRIIVVA